MHRSLIIICICCLFIITKHSKQKYTGGKQVHPKNKCFGSTTKMNCLDQSFLSYDNFELNCVQPTNYIELDELAFPLNQRYFTAITFHLIIGNKAKFLG